MKKILHILSIILILLLDLYVFLQWLSEPLEAKSLSEQGLLAASTFAVILLMILQICVIFYERRHREELIRQETEKMLSQEMKAFQLKQRVQRHDFHIHLMALSGLLQEKKYTECQNYLSRMITQAREVNQILPLDDPAVSAMLNQEIQDAKDHGVKISCEIHDDLSKIPLDAYEINQILGNLIRNAVEAVEVLDNQQKEVSVTILHRRAHVIFRVENPVDRPVTTPLFTYGYSGKEGHSGIGLNGVKAIVKKYKGSIFPEQEEGLFRMVVTIPMIKEN